MKRVTISGILILTFILIGTAIAVLYARGYRFNNQNMKFIEGTGILVATSKPDGARVFINDHLSTATNNTINLSPGNYEVRIERDGYFSWKKQIIIKKETVSEAYALLLPIAPKFAPITTTGAQNVTIDATGTILAYTVSSASASPLKNGIYVMNMSSQPIISIGSGVTQIATNTIDRFSDAKLSFSPDGKNILAQISNGTASTYYLLLASGINDSPQDVTNTLAQVQKDWDAQKVEKNKKLMDSLPRELKAVAGDLFSNITPSVEGTKLLYTASQSADLPLILKKPIPGADSTTEQRKLKEGNVYVYDMKEDKNFLIFDSSSLKKGESAPQFMWYPDARHLVTSNDGKINVLDYDGLNVTTVYAGPFVPNIVYPWPDGSSIVIVTKLNNMAAPDNLYRIGLQ